MRKNIFIFGGILLCGLLSACSGEVSKQLKPLRTLIKNKQGGEAVKLMATLQKDSVLALEPKLFELGKQAQLLVNDVENEKIYLKQPYDTVKFFGSTMAVFDHILECERLEQQRFAMQGTKMKYHKENNELVHLYYPNLNAAGRFFYSKKNYSETLKYMERVLEVPKSTIWGDDRSVTRQQGYVDNAYLYLRSAFFNKDYALVERYKDLVLADTAYRNATLEMLTLSAEALHDTTKYVGYLQQGLHDYPSSTFYFSRLTDYLTDKKDYRGALYLADSLLTVDRNNVLFLVSKSLSLLNLQRNVEAIEVSQRILELEPEAVAPLYYIGAAYCNLANNLILPTNINSVAYKTVAAKQKYYYTEARPYMEKYRELAPEEKQRWAPLLYRIYLSLNKGHKFDEIEKIMRGL